LGGFGSGRYGGRPTAEATASYVIDIARLTRGGLRAGILATANTQYDGGDFPIDLVIDTRGAFNHHIQFTHPTRNDQYRDKVTYTVNLTTTRPHFGGVRWWFVCPRSGRATPKLFLPNGGLYFWSRRAYGLGYACQRETKSDRLMRKSRKLHRALGGHGQAIGDALPPPKPKWMRWRTYERKVASWRAADEQADAAWIEGAARFLVRRGWL